MHDGHDFAICIISIWVAGFTKLYPATARVFTMFKVYRRNEGYLPGHPASDIPSEYTYYSDGMSEAV